MIRGQTRDAVIRPALKGGTRDHRSLLGGWVDDANRLVENRLVGIEYRATDQVS